MWSSRHTVALTQAVSAERLCENICREVRSACRHEVVFDASPETARRLIKLGRKDARKVLAEAGMAK
jgi:hypothetical protein